MLISDIKHSQMIVQKYFSKGFHSFHFEITATTRQLNS